MLRNNVSKAMFIFSIYVKKIFFVIKLPLRITHYIINTLKFNSFKISSFIDKPLRIDGAKNISIGANVIVQYKSWLAAIPLTGEKKCSLVIEDGCIIGHFNHIFVTKSVVLHKKVLTADRVYISDNIHGYGDIYLPIMDQPIVQKNSIEIGEGSWLGENVCVIGASIGKHCVIGANSVVTKDIPDYCVAVGSPARVIKRYNFVSKKWQNFN